MRLRMLTIVALVAVAVIAPAAAAYAQCGPSVSVEENLRAADVVFLGKVVDRSNRDRTAVMEVLEIWKGRALPPEVVVNGGPEDVTQQTSIDRTFLLGQVYLVVPANAKSPFQDSLCTGTQLWATPTGEIPENLQDAVGAETPTPVYTREAGPVGDDGGLSSGAGNLVAALAVILGALSVVFIVKRLSSDRGRRRKRNPSQSMGTPAPGLPTAPFRNRRRKAGRKALPSLFESKGPSRLDRVRRGSGRFRKGPGAHEKEQLERAVKSTDTTPPSRKNHYTSGRRSTR